MQNLSQHISKLREDFSKGKLSETDVQKNPATQFEIWLQQAIDAQIEEAQAMVLSSVSENNLPHSRILYLRGFENNTYRFFGNYNSTKGKNISLNPNACINFFWNPLQRQIRIEGTVSKLSAAESDEYFSTRPRDSQIGAWVSEQSSIISSRSELEKRVQEFEEKFSGINVPRPENWGGWKLQANYYEFWQGRPSRLHDRICYKKENENWNIFRLAP